MLHVTQHFFFFCHTCYFKLVSSLLGCEARNGKCWVAFTKNELWIPLLLLLVRVGYVHGWAVLRGKKKLRGRPLRFCGSWEEGRRTRGSWTRGEVKLGMRAPTWSTHFHSSHSLMQPPNPIYLFIYFHCFPPLKLPLFFFLSRVCTNIPF